MRNAPRPRKKWGRACSTKKYFIIKRPRAAHGGGRGRGRRRLMRAGSAASSSRPWQVSGCLTTCFTCFTGTCVTSTFDACWKRCLLIVHVASAWLRYLLYLLAALLAGCFICFNCFTGTCVTSTFEALWKRCLVIEHVASAWLRYLLYSLYLQVALLALIALLVLALPVRLRRAGSAAWSSHLWKLLGYVTCFTRVTCFTCFTCFTCITCFTCWLLYLL